MTTGSSQKKQRVWVQHSTDSCSLLHVAWLAHGWGISSLSFFSLQPWLHHTLGSFLQVPASPGGPGTSPTSILRSWPEGTSCFLAQPFPWGSHFQTEWISRPAQLTTPIARKFFFFFDELAPRYSWWLIEICPQFLLIVYVFVFYIERSWEHWNSWAFHSQPLWMECSFLTEETDQFPKSCERVSSPCRLIFNFQAAAVSVDIKPVLALFSPDAPLGATCTCGQPTLVLWASFWPSGYNRILCVIIYFTDMQKVPRLWVDEFDGTFFLSESQIVIWI